MYPSDQDEKVCCADCKWFDRIPTRHDGEKVFGNCRYSPPTLIQVVNETESYGMTCWPEVSAEDCCAVFTR